MAVDRRQVAKPLSARHSAMMVDADGELTIRSRYGALRDLLPIYSLYQLVPNFLAIGGVVWLTIELGYFSKILPLAIMLGWVFQFTSRPSEMAIAPEQAMWLEAVLQEQGYFTKSEADGRWRALGEPRWRRLPHHSIDFVPGDPTTVIAPRDTMESLRDSLELLEEHGVLSYAAEGKASSFEPSNPQPEPAIAWHVKAPALLLAAICIITFFVTVGGGSDGFDGWGLSAAALRSGQYQTIVLHMLAHGGGMHLAMNMTALAGLGPALTFRLGPTPFNGLRFLLLFFLSGLAGAAFYLALHPFGTVPMVGASGGIYGLLGLWIRMPTEGENLRSVRSVRVRRVGWDLLKQNAFLFSLLAVVAWSSGGAGGLAWEAHLGGFLFGLCVGPVFLPRTKDTKAGETSTTDMPLAAG